MFHIGIRNIVRAFKGRRQFLHEDGIQPGSDLPTYIADAEEGDHVIHGIQPNDAWKSQVRDGSASVNGGCSIRRTLSVLIVVTYKGHGDMPRAILKSIADEVVRKGF